MARVNAIVKFIAIFKFILFFCEATIAIINPLIIINFKNDGDGKKYYVIVTIIKYNYDLHIISTC